MAWSNLSRDVAEMFAALVVIDVKDSRLRIRDNPAGLFSDETPELKKARREKEARYRARNPEKVAARHAAYHAANREKRIAYMKAWREARRSVDRMPSASQAT